MLIVADGDLRKNLFQGREMLPPMNEIPVGFVMLIHQVTGQQSLRTVVMTDVAGFTELMGSNEPQTLEFLRADMDILKNEVEVQGGEVIKFAGDSMLALFTSAPKAVRACIDAQEKLTASTLKHRIAIHAGEVTISNGDAYGDAVNVCARLENAAVPGTIMASRIVIDLIRSQDLPAPFQHGKLQLKGVAGPVEIFSWGGTKRRRISFRKYYIGAAVLAAIGGGGLFFRPGSSGESIADRLSITKKKHPKVVASSASKVGTNADELLDQAYDELWQEFEEFDKVKEDAVKKEDPQLVIDWLRANPLGQRERGQLELEHWNLVNDALLDGKKLAGDKATPEQIIVALEGWNDPGKAVELRAFKLEFEKPK